MPRCILPPKCEGAVALPSTSIAARTRDRSALASHVMAGRLADDQTHYPSEVPNRAAGIFRMAGHMLGERLLHRRGLVVSLVDDDPQTFPLRWGYLGLDLCQHAFNSRGAGLHAWWSSRAQRLSCREQPGRQSRPCGLRVALASASQGTRALCPSRMPKPLQMRAPTWLSSVPSA